MNDGPGAHSWPVPRAVAVVLALLVVVVAILQVA